MRATGLLGLIVVVSVVSLPAFAQDIVSARAGLIHYSEGRVLLNEKPIVHKATQFLEVKEGEYLRTDRGRAEVLLSPGIFLRLGEDSQAQMLASRLTDVRLRLLAGAAVIEADELLKANSIKVNVGDAEVQLLRTGLYRLDIQQDESPRLRVFVGEALVTASGAEYRVKGKKEMALAGDFEIKKFDTDDTDPLDRWSKRRAGYLATANISASRLAYRRGVSLSSSQWIWNPYYGMFTFLPYRSVCWSPYGYGFYSPRAVYVLYNPPRPVDSGFASVGAPSRSYNSSYGYTSVGHTSAGTSGVIASSPSSPANQGGGATVSRGTTTDGGGGARR